MRTLQSEGPIQIPQNLLRFKPIISTKACNPSSQVQIAFENQSTAQLGWHLRTYIDLQPSHTSTPLLMKFASTKDPLSSFFTGELDEKDGLVAGAMETYRNHCLAATCDLRPVTLDLPFHPSIHMRTSFLCFVSRAKRQSPLLYNSAAPLPSLSLKSKVLVLTRTHDEQMYDTLYLCATTASMPPSCFPPLVEVSRHCYLHSIEESEMSCTCGLCLDSVCFLPLFFLLLVIQILLL
mmetsp:Transcript_28757/g.34936  ORF Transcript_28757/g.34936 Transcript_28757/m.34936 type:complete len:236 (+) Transcript_28757:568-1275(+)